MLDQFRLGDRNRLRGGIEQDRSGRRGPLIDGQDMVRLHCRMW
jgi:hypothetical protein